MFTIHSDIRIDFIRPLDDGARIRTRLLAQEVWRAASPRHRRAILWDVEEAERPALLHALLERASLAAFASADGAPLALAWASPLLAGSQTAQVHFMFANPPRELTAKVVGSAFLACAHASWPCVLALLPQSYRGARAFLQRIGFREAASLPGICRLAGQTRPKTGVMLVHGAEDFGGNFCGGKLS